MVGFLILISDVLLPLNMLSGAGGLLSGLDLECPSPTKYVERD